MPELGTSGSVRGAPCKCVQLSRLRWRPRQSLASSRVPSFAWRPVTAVAKRRQGGCRPESSEREDNPKSIVIGVADPVPQGGRQNLRSRQCEWAEVLPGFVHTYQGVGREQGRSIRPARL